VNIATQPRTPGRLRTLNPFDLGREKNRTARKESSREERRSASPLDLGCVDWYLYPVSRKPRQSES
jgi:hypothetical protein